LKKSWPRLERLRLPLESAMLRSNPKPWLSVDIAMGWFCRDKPARSRTRRMAEMTIQLKIDPVTGKKEIIIALSSDDDSLPHEHEQQHQALVEKLIEGGYSKLAKLGSRHRTRRRRRTVAPLQCSQISGQPAKATNARWLRASKQLWQWLLRLHFKMAGVSRAARGAERTALAHRSGQS
jgi:hypothetical protein